MRGFPARAPGWARGYDLKVMQMHWWFQEGLVGWVAFFLFWAFVIGLGLVVWRILRTGLRGRLR
jgi:hypothetical protein